MESISGISHILFNIMSTVSIVMRNSNIAHAIYQRNMRHSLMFGCHKSTGMEMGTFSVIIVYNKLGFSFSVTQGVSCLWG